MGKVHQRAVSRCPGTIFPTPYPPGYGATRPLPRPAHSARDVSRSMPEADPYGNAGCALHRRRRTKTAPLGDQAGLLPSPTARRAGTGAPRCGSPPTPCAGPTVHPRGHAAPAPSRPPRPKPSARPTDRYRPVGRDQAARRRRRIIPHDRPSDLARGRKEAASPRGCAPVDRPNHICTTIYFQPTSYPCHFLAELADQPPCHQAGRDRAVRFHPTRTGHECEAHFPAGPLNETLRDRMLPAKLPCRHNAGW